MSKRIGTYDYDKIFEQAMRCLLAPKVAQICSKTNLFFSTTRSAGATKMNTVKVEGVGIGVCMAKPQVRHRKIMLNEQIC